MRHTQVARHTPVAAFGAARDLALILQTLDCVVPDGAGAYLAAPISTGRRYFEAMARYRAGSLDELISRIGEEEYLQQVRWPNVEDGERVAASLRQQGVQNLIHPGPLFIQDWPAARYMDLCFALIERKVGTVYLHPEWAFSSGAVQEFFFCTERRMRIADSGGRTYTVEAARADLEGVRGTLLDLRLPVAGVEASLHQLENLISV
jgi:hypothetical protein